MRWTRMKENLMALYKKVKEKSASKQDAGQLAEMLLEMPDIEDGNHLLENLVKARALEYEKAIRQCQQEFYEI